MNKNEMYDEAVKIYEDMVDGDIFIEAAEDHDSNRRLFLSEDEEDYRHYPINNMSVIKPIDLFYKNSFFETIDSSKFESILNSLDCRLFQSIQEIIVVMNSDDERYFEESYGGWLLEESLGQLNKTKNVVVVNLIKIIEYYAEYEFIDDVDYLLNACFEGFYPVLCREVVITLIHELCHANLNDNLLPLEYMIFSKDDYDRINEDSEDSEDSRNNEDSEEDLVENYSRIFFNSNQYNLDWNFVNQSGIKSYILNNKDFMFSYE